MYWPEEGMPAKVENDRVALYTWDEWLETGNEISDETIVEKAKNVEPGSCATLIYTSGTTVGGSGGR